MNNKSFKTKRKDIYAAVTDQIEAGISPIYETWANQLLKGREANEVLGALLTHCFDTELTSDGSEEKKNDRSNDSSNDVRLFVGRGKRDGLTARGLVSIVLEK